MDYKSLDKAACSDAHRSNAICANVNWLDNILAEYRASQHSVTSVHGSSILVRKARRRHPTEAFANEDPNVAGDELDTATGEEKSDGVSAILFCLIGFAGGGSMLMGRGFWASC